MGKQDTIEIDYFSDLLCVWAYLAQARLDELATTFGAQISIGYRYFNLFGDTAHKIGRGWADRGGDRGFGEHLHQVGQQFEHIELHQDLWAKVRPASSSGAHLAVKAAQLLGTHDRYA